MFRIRHSLGESITMFACFGNGFSSAMALEWATLFRLLLFVVPCMVYSILTTQDIYYHTGLYLSKISLCGFAQYCKSLGYIHRSLPTWAILNTRQERFKKWHKQYRCLNL